MPTKQLNLNAYKVMRVFFENWPEKIKKAAITFNFVGIEIEANNHSQTCIWSKLIMQLNESTFSDFVIFIQKKWVENLLQEKSEFCVVKQMNSFWAPFPKFPIRLGPEIVERSARFSIKIQDNFKLISDYPSDLPDFRLSEVVRWPAFKCARCHPLASE